MSSSQLGFTKRTASEGRAIPTGLNLSAQGGRAPDYYLVYLGKQALTNWEFKLPKPPQGKGQPPADGLKFTAEVLDTWNMTVIPVPSAFTLRKQTDYFHADRDGRSIPLPGKPYMAIRIQRVKE